MEINPPQIDEAALKISSAMVAKHLNDNGFHAASASGFAYYALAKCAITAYLSAITQPDIDAIRQEARNAGLGEAAQLTLLLDMQDPATGPFSKEDKAIEQYRNAINALKKNTKI